MTLWGRWVIAFWADTGICIHPLQREKFDQLEALHLTLGEDAFNGSILRNQVGAPCAARTSFTPNLCCFLQVSVVSQNRYVSGNAGEHLSGIAQAVAGYYLRCLVTEPHCWFSLRAPACIFITLAHLPSFHQMSLASGCDRCSQKLAALTRISCRCLFLNLYVLQ